MKAGVKTSEDILGVVIGHNVESASFSKHLPHHWQEKVLGHTNIGRGRRKNQDAASVYVSFNDGQASLVLCVADGLGSSFFSEKAAGLAVSRVPEALILGDDLAPAFEKVHRTLLEQQLQSELPNMGTTTLVAAKIEGSHLHVANVGDSRAYVIRQGKIIYQTLDQSAVWLMFCAGEIAEKEGMRRHPLRNVILNAMGSVEPFYRFVSSRSVDVEMKPSGIPLIDEVILEKGDKVLLASDGFFGNITDEEIITLLEGRPWDQLEGVLSGAVQNVFLNHETSLKEPVSLDNYTFVVYRHL